MDSVEEEDVFPEQSELGKYESTEEVQNALKEFGIENGWARTQLGNRESDTSTVLPNTSAVNTTAAHSYSKLGQPLKCLLSLFTTPRHEKVVRLHEKFLKVFPENRRVLENLESLKSLKQQSQLSLLLARMNIRWAEVFQNQQASFFVPVIFVGQILLTALHQAWHETVEGKVLQELHSLTFDLKRCWIQLLEELESTNGTKESVGIISKTTDVFRKCLLSTSDYIEKEITLLQASCSNATWLEERAFMFKKSLTESENKSTHGPVFTEIQSLTELVFEQILEYSFRLSSYYCWSETDNSLHYNPSGLNSSIYNLRKVLATEFFHAWEVHIKTQNEAICTYAERSRDTIAKFTRESKLLQTTGMLQDRLSATSLLLMEVERLMTNKQNGISKSELLYLKDTIHTELCAIQNLGVMETSLIDSLANGCESPDVVQIRPESKLDNNTPLPDIQSPNQISHCTRLTFENEVADKQDSGEQEIGAANLQDEVFELISIGGIQRNAGNVQDEEKIERSTIMAQKILLGQLKETLKPRREDMKNRERDAYFRNYGKYPEEQDDEEPVRPSAKPARLTLDEAKEEYEKSLQELDFTEDEDEIVDEEMTNIILTQPTFTKFLDQMISNNQSKTSEGIIPIQRKDKYYEANYSNSDSEED